MASSPPDADWIVTERTPSLLWVLMCLIPAVAVVSLLLFYYLGVLAAAGPTATSEAIGAGIVGSFLAGGWFVNMTRPQAIRVAVNGVEVRPLVGRIQSYSWGQIVVRPGRPPQFGALILDRPSGVAYALSPNQYVALKSSPYRAQQETPPP
jgi:hypothetical protein